MKTPRTEAALEAFKAKVIVKGTTEADLIAAVDALVQAMGSMERELNAELDNIARLTLSLQDSPKSLQGQLNRWAHDRNGIERRVSTFDREMFVFEHNFFDTPPGCFTMRSDRRRLVMRKQDGMIPSGDEIQRRIDAKEYVETPL